MNFVEPFFLCHFEKKRRSKKWLLPVFFLATHWFLRFLKIHSQQALVHLWEASAEPSPFFLWPSRWACDFKGKPPYCPRHWPFEWGLPFQITVHTGALSFVFWPLVQAPLKTSFSQGISKLLLFIGIICEVTQSEIIIFLSSSIFLSHLFFVWTFKGKLYQSLQCMAVYGEFPLLHCHEFSK